MLPMNTILLHFIHSKCAHAFTIIPACCLLFELGSEVLRGFLTHCRFCNGTALLASLLTPASGFKQCICSIISACPSIPIEKCTSNSFL